MSGEVRPGEVGALHGALKATVRALLIFTLSAEGATKGLE